MYNGIEQIFQNFPSENSSMEFVQLRSVNKTRAKKNMFFGSSWKNPFFNPKSPPKHPNLNTNTVSNTPRRFPARLEVDPVKGRRPETEHLCSVWTHRKRQIKHRGEMILKKLEGSCTWHQLLDQVRLPRIQMTPGGSGMPPGEVIFLTFFSYLNHPTFQEQPCVRS